jgi:hypothetical protein
MKLSILRSLALFFTSTLFINQVVAWGVDLDQGDNCDGSKQSYGDSAEDSGCINLLHWTGTDDGASSFDWNAQGQPVTLSIYGDDDCTGNKASYSRGGCYGVPANFYPGGGVHSFHVHR